MKHTSSKGTIRYFCREQTDASCPFTKSGQKQKKRKRIEGRDKGYNPKAEDLPPFLSIE
jgi:hypothetical protein